MIKLMTDNDIFEAIVLMKKSVADNDYCDSVAYNERAWIEHLTNHVFHQSSDRSWHYIAVKDVTECGTLRGFMLASTYACFYNQNFVMDVKDCIVDHDYNNAFTVTRLFNYMIDQCRERGITSWRADSIRAGDKAEEYIEFLAKKYNARPFTGVHGKVT